MRCICTKTRASVALCWSREQALDWREVADFRVSLLWHGRRASMSMEAKAMWR